MVTWHTFPNAKRPIPGDEVELVHPCFVRGIVERTFYRDDIGRTIYVIRGNDGRTYNLVRQGFAFPAE